MDGDCRDVEHRFVGRVGRRREFAEWAAARVGGWVAARVGVMGGGASWGNGRQRELGGRVAARVYGVGGLRELAGWVAARVCLSSISFFLCVD